MLIKRVLALTTAVTMVLTPMTIAKGSETEPAAETESGIAYNDSYMMTITDDPDDIFNQGSSDEPSNVDYSYLSHPGFDVMMYNNGYNGMFGDEHLSGITLILHGERVAGNGDIHLLPVPEQWDAATPVTSSTLPDEDYVG